MSRRTVPCPTCRQPAEFSSANRFRPFCSERCKQIDLGAWASENFRIEGQDGEADPGESGTTGQPPLNKATP
ncbi:MAG: DNA gyrase inhibitor YacG [Burkholderiales bacterium]|jgi:endogenous inhibitor of DNA gyrase (YacG/DUF329 family)